MATDGTCLIPAGPLTLATSVRLREQEMKDEKRGREWRRLRLMKNKKKRVGMKDETQNGERETSDRKLARL